MADNLRFAALAAALFVLSYSGVAWALAGAHFPALSHVVATRAPDTRVAALTPPAQPSRSAVSADPGSNQNISPRDRLRLAAYQASIAYTQAPCNATAKANLIAAVSAYAQAWHDLMDCGAGRCDPTKLNAAATAFSTPLDMHVREAIADAFDKHGISIDDFPPALRINVMMIARAAGDASPVCGASAAAR
ncbi:MAG TPA: hypothetical protein VFA53_00990 [Xanthobacteraceae bacterium]|nr:hypothetical protein [Xanthobacteraceae bacterium]